MSERRQRRGERRVEGRQSSFMGDLMGDDHGHDDTMLMTKIGLPKHQEEPEAASRREHRRRSPAGGRRKPRLVPTLLVLALVVAGLGVAWHQVSPYVSRFSMGDGGLGEDYEGDGTDEVRVRVPRGASAPEVGKVLQESDVIKSGTRFAALANVDERWNKVEPGTFKVRRHMSVDAALAALSDRRNRTGKQVLVKEGQRKYEIFATLSKETGIPVAEFEKVKGAEVGLPPEAKGDLEGWLFPARYWVEDDFTAREYIKQMVAAATTQVEALGLPRSRWQEIVITASIVEAEGGDESNYGKVARVIENRLANTHDFPTLGMDSTVHYIYRQRGDVQLSYDMMRNPDPRNTYRFPGLPSGPISSPGAAALAAAANPEEGPWTWFTTVDPCTGDTRFETSAAEHEESVQLLNEWQRQHPGGKC